MTYRHDGSSPGALSAGAAKALAQGLGWFSIALGTAEMMAPRTFTRAFGMEDHEGLVRAYGMREIATGIGILAARNPAPWVWGRVGGDVLDLATLTTGLEGHNPRKGNVGIALAAVAGVTALDLMCAQALGAERRMPRLPPRDYGGRSGLPRPPDEMRGAARDFEVPRDMRIPEALRPYTTAG